MKPMAKITKIPFWLVALMFMGQLSSLPAQGTAFTYQGRLNNNGSPANGSYDFIFTLFGVSSGGTAIAGPVTNAATAVSNGLFIATVDFGDAFTGSSNWLQISVSTNGANSFGTLTPRQQLMPTPYAISAESVSGSINASQLAGGTVPTNVLAGFQGPFFSIVGGGVGNYVYNQYDVIGGGQANNLFGADGFIGGGYDNSAGSSGPYATVGGGEGNNAGGTDATVSGGQNNAASGVYATVSGGYGNTVYALYGFIGSGYENTITAYAPYAAIVSGQNNLISGDVYGRGYSIIAAGLNNTIFTNAPLSVIGGGQVNSIAGDSNDSGSSVIGGGKRNQIMNNSPYSAIAGGTTNTISPGAPFSVIGGGVLNFVTGDFNNYGSSFIGGGANNSITNNSEFSVIGGGQNNVIYTNSPDAIIGGGQVNEVCSIASGIFSGIQNVIYQDTNNLGGSVICGGDENGILPEAYQSVIAGGGENEVNYDAIFSTIGGGQENEVGDAYATVPGGQGNSADGYASFAAGYYASANNDGTFVWADAEGNFGSTADNQFLIQADGGVGIGTNAPAAQLHVSSNGGGNSPQLRLDQMAGGGYSRLRMTLVPTGATWDIAEGGSGSVLNFFASPKPGAAGTNILTLLPSGNATLLGTLAQGSDRAHKENLQAIDPQAVLDKIAAMPITKWNYLTEHGVEHLGPMAQDFYAAFQLGADDRHITTVDEGGVALAAIQGLNEKLKAETAENAELKARIEKLEQIVYGKAGGAK